jgi:acetyl-CoA carboxylase biotin carboxyl carrier protein
MKAKEIQDLIEFVSKCGMDEVNIETDQIKLHVKKHSEVKMISAPASAPVAAQPSPAQPAQAPTSASNQATAAGGNSESQYVAIKAPMIGTFYRSANPESPAFVNVGDRVEKGETVCIIEAMKLFNEIESEISGTIVKVIVDNASPVEYDQVLYLIDPS